MTRTERRSLLKMELETLQLCAVAPIKTLNLLYKVRTSSVTLRRILYNLLRLELLEKLDGQFLGDKRTKILYRTTAKGVSFLEALRKLERLTGVKLEELES